MSSNPFNTGAAPATTPPSANGGNPFGTPAATGDESWEVDMSASTSNLLPPGVYSMRVADVVREISKAGDPMYTWTMEVVQGPYAGQTTKTWTSLAPQALFRFEELVGALGYSRNAEGKITFTKNDVLHRLFVGTVIPDVYNGRPTSKLDGIAPHPEGVGLKAVPATATAGVPQ